MPEDSTPRRERKRTVQQMVIVGVIASAVGIAIGLSIHWFPPADSTQADKIDTLWDVLIGSRSSGPRSRRSSSSAS